MQYGNQNGVWKAGARLSKQVSEKRAGIITLSETGPVDDYAKAIDARAAEAVRSLPFAGP